MRDSHIALAFLPFITAIGSGCAANVGANVDAESAGELEASQGELRKSPNAGFYVVTARDVRRCASPMCGGMFVKRCADGAVQASCYVSDIDASRLALSETDAPSFRSALLLGQVLVHATRMGSTMVNGERIGKLIVDEAWLAQGVAAIPSGMENVLPSGSFFRVADNGIRCIRAPCPTTSMFALNGVESRSATDLDLSGAGASEAQVEAAFNARYTEKGFLLSGSVVIGETEGVTVVATQFYAPVIGSAAQSVQKR
jgi:hypothetical protein